MASVLIVDDEPNIRRMIGALLGAEGYDVREAADGRAGARAVEEDEPDVALIDLMMPGELDGLATLARIRERWSDLPVVMMSGRASLGDAVRATKLGAVNFLEKPLAPEAVLLALASALELRQTRRAARALRAELGLSGDMVGSSDVMARVRGVIERVAPSDARVLITGESGTGKELVAAAIHEHSPRRDHPFVRVNCAAIPRDLVESEMFGHEKGAFTGAAERRVGKFELADTGTLFLDEVGDLSLEAQAKLLRAIEAKEIQRVGGNKTIRVDVRIVSATNHDLAQAVRDGAFREDLYFRLNVIPVQLPALRERGADVVELVRHFSDVQRQRTGRPLLRWSDEAFALVRAYAWPGNVRELANIVERIAILSNDARVSAADVAAVLPVAGDRAAGERATTLAPEQSLTDALDATERVLIGDALAWAQGNVAEAARRLRTDRANLYRRMRRLGMTVPLLVLAAMLLLPRAARAQGDSTRATPAASTTIIPETLAVDDASHSVVAGLRLSSGKTYNRVEGLPILLGPAVTVQTPSIDADIAAFAIGRTGRWHRLAEPDGGHDVRLRTRFGPDKMFGVSARLFSVVAPVEPWQMSEPDAGLAAFLLRRDYLDYYGRHGASAAALWSVNAKATLTVGYADERWGSMDARNPFTLFREGAHWRRNPATDEGVVHLLTLGGTIDTRNDEREPSGGWYLVGSYEHGSSPALARAPELQGGRVGFGPAAPAMWNRLFFDFRRYNRVSPRTEVNVRLVGGGWMTGDELPLERKFSLGGPGTLPGYDFRERVGTPDALQCTAPGVSPSDNPVMCDRAVLGQLEVRTELASHPFELFNIPAFRLRRVGFTAQPVGVLFTDIGRGWRTTQRWPSDYKSDIGAGLDLGLFGVYVAKAVSDWQEPANVLVRVRRRF